ncbi:hypothetical protein A3E39_01720 [Candidatus Uhrbacteria bacterium RIFCSPHIGHO2_12_FULL_60_25]|uniref:AAA+ ATPase domain-containing protein n=1 Tax=Candidatus Uhrbacteria bacterium RIFCSPHIGHO2_12_FULL_60_25 TaxID=1802399 RepID=A0A1F7ULL4_9BACT|nr:MAG: hypothetical protein A3D73_01895 [Candidatus Uhrbacteria bacterium RIFCSPHIGHO2_02_FULL_60_44]OGL78634.1 MAG: hypothetical protein A3E39_01720 [Candidatus Uhrbacteria bacterium RIFCSPHIGHO2_12_FULL_60_25]
MPTGNVQILIILLAIGAMIYLWVTTRRGQQGAGFRQSAVLGTYTRDLTKEAEGHVLDPVVGRSKEIDRLIHILSRRTKNNPLLLGEPGVGKTAIVEGIARRIAAGNVPDTLKNKHVLALDLGGLISGTKYRGEFEERMKKLTDEIKGMARQVILFIDEVHMIEQAKGAEGAMNVSDILKPALSRGELQAIGATTWKEYEHFIKPDDALNRRFQPVVVGEPSEAAALEIIRGIKGGYEKHHKVVYTDDALKAAVTLSKHIRDRYLPDKAIDLIDEAGAKVSIEAAHSTRHAIGLLHAAGASVRERIATLASERSALEKELAHVKKLEATMEGETEITEIRSRMEHLVQEIDALRARTGSGAGQKAPTVTVLDIRGVLAEWIGNRKF